MISAVSHRESLRKMYVPAPSLKAALVAHIEQCCSSALQLPPPMTEVRITEYNTRNYVSLQPAIQVLHFWSRNYKKMESLEGM